MHGADTARVFVLFKAPVDVVLDWDAQAIKGPARWLQRVWTYAPAPCPVCFFFVWGGGVIWPGRQPVGSRTPGGIVLRTCACGRLAQETAAATSVLAARSDDAALGSVTRATVDKVRPVVCGPMNRDAWGGGRGENIRVTTACGRCLVGFARAACERARSPRT